MTWVVGGASKRQEVVLGPGGKGQIKVIIIKNIPTQIDVLRFPSKTIFFVKNE